MDAKQGAILRFRQASLKHPMSKFVLEYLLENQDLLSRVSFVTNRDLLSNTLLIAESGSDAPPFELELGACQREEVTIESGRLVRHVYRTRSLCVTEPIAALEALRNFRGRLYVMFAFARRIPDWYRQVAEPNPALPHPSTEEGHPHGRSEQLLREQVDLLLLTVLMRHEIDQALARRDEAAFRSRVRLYRELSERCLVSLQ